MFDLRLDAQKLTLKKINNGHVYRFLKSLKTMITSFKRIRFKKTKQKRTYLRMIPDMIKFFLSNLI